MWVEAANGSNCGVRAGRSTPADGQLQPDHIRRHSRVVGRLPAPGDEPRQGGRANRQGRMGGANNPELDALQTAINDKAPDAEIKARLERLREVRKENEVKLTKAQEDLRAVLSVRQEAGAVLAGLLP